MKIANFDTDKSVLLIAELSANHSGSLELAIETIKAAKRAGADAIKLQTYTADSLTLNSKNDDFMIKGGLWDGYDLYSLYEEALTPREWHEKLFQVAEDEGLICFSSPFCNDDADFLEQFNPPAYKIASFEVTDYDFVEHIAKKGKPVIISTGIATEEEIYDVVKICRDCGNEDVALLKCTSSYPAPLEDMNLRTIADMKAKFNVIPGFSDHTLGIVAPVVAVSLGARIVEKHFILKDTEKLLGSVTYELDQKSALNRYGVRSLYASADIKKGEIFSEKNVRSVRPGYGLHPKFLKELIGKPAKRDIKFSERIKKEDLI